MDQKSILITGSSSGIGFTAAKMLKARGYRVFATARKEVDVARLKEQDFESVKLDITDSDSIKKALAEILVKTGGTLDALFNNAGFIQIGAIEDLTREMDHAQFETNVYGPIELIRNVLPIMRNQGYGRIIQNSSILGLVTIPYCGAYNASKFALVGYTNTLRQELRGSRIYVSIIAPGPIKSELRNNAYEVFKKTISIEKSNHAHIYKKMETNYFQNVGAGKLGVGPQAVVKKLISALESSHPKAHYYVGLPAQSLAIFKRILPEGLLDWILTTIR